VTIQTKATEKNFPVMLFIMLNKVVSTFFLKTKTSSLTFRVTPNEYYLSMVQFIVLYKVIVSLEPLFLDAVF